MSDKQLGLVLGINPRKVCQSVPPAADKMARIALADPLTFHAIMAEALARVRGEALRNGITLPVAPNQSATESGASAGMA